MKPKRFGLFASIKYIDKNIDTYKKIADVIRKEGIDMYKPEFVDDYPNSKKKTATKNDSIVEGTQKQIRYIDFAVAFFSDKSRTVFFQTILALENKIPVLCVIHENSYENFPETLLSYGEDFITVRKYKNLNDLEEILTDYINEIEPPKRRFNVVLKTTTLKQMEQLSSKMDYSKAELIRFLVEKEYKRIFGSR